MLARHDRSDRPLTLEALGARQIYFKYCSTFDSTPAGNIGPVTEALMAAIGTPFTIATPAFPDNDLLRLGPALRDLPLVTAGSGVALGLPALARPTPLDEAQIAELRSAM